MAVVARLLPGDWDGRRLLRFLTGLALLALAFTARTDGVEVPAVEAAPVVVVVTVDEAPPVACAPAADNAAQEAPAATSPAATSAGEVAPAGATQAMPPVVLAVAAPAARRGDMARTGGPHGVVETEGCRPGSPRAPPGA